MPDAMREDLASLRTETERGFAETGQGFAEVRATLDRTAAGQEQVAALLTRLVERDSDGGGER